jgi:hypothetical protein
MQQGAGDGHMVATPGNADSPFAGEQQIAKSAGKRNKNALRQIHMMNVAPHKSEQVIDRTDK